MRVCCTVATVPPRFALAALILVRGGLFCGLAKLLDRGSQIVTDLTPVLGNGSKVALLQLSRLEVLRDQVCCKVVEQHCRRTKSLQESAPESSLPRCAELDDDVCHCSCDASTRLLVPATCGMFLSLLTSVTPTGRVCLLQPAEPLSHKASKAKGNGDDRGEGHAKVGCHVPTHVAHFGLELCV